MHTVQCSYRVGHDADGGTGDGHTLHGVSRIVAQVRQGHGEPELYVGSRITLFTFVSSFLTSYGVRVVALGAWQFILDAYPVHVRVIFSD
jgi:hypothetical protein